MDFPQKVILPLRSEVDTSLQQCWDYVRGSLAALPGTRVEIQSGRARLQFVAWCCLPMIVDDVLAVVDMSDYLEVSPAHSDYPLYLKWHFTPAHSPLQYVGSFPPASFFDWAEYPGIPLPLTSQNRTRSKKCQANNENAEQREKIIHRQYIPPDNPSRPLDQQVRRRRLIVQKALEKAFGNQVDSEICPLPEYFRRAATCLVSVHAPGSWGHILGRGQWQSMGLGACTISPDIWTAPLEERLEPWIHYVPVRDSYSDLVDRVRWCQENPAESWAIGQRAREFFKSHGTPDAIWRYVLQRLRTLRDAGISPTVPASRRP